MKEIVYLDTDVIMDFLTQREKFFEHSLQVFKKIENKEITAYVSSLIIWNLFYWLEKYLGTKEAKKKIKKFRLLVNIISVDSRIIDMALESDSKDFEDSIQYYAALSMGIKTFLTRNKKDYKKGNMTFLDCEEFLKLKFFHDSH
jgi:predicted nucleic acid-binding protein